MKMKKAIILVLAVFMLALTAVPAAAMGNVYDSIEDVPYTDSSPVIGEFIADPEMAAFVAKKEAWATEVANSIRRSGSRYSVTLSISQVAQERSNWCGYAAMKSLTDYEGYSVSQQTLARIVYPTGTISGLPWYWSNGNSYSQFPAATTLRQYSYVSYVPYPYGPAGSSPITVASIEDKIVGDINYGYGVLANGASHAIGDSHLPGYPAETVWHWLVVYGFSNSGSTIHIADPAKSSAVSWSDDIEAYYSLTSSELTAFVAPRGIIW